MFNYTNKRLFINNYQNIDSVAQLEICRVKVKILLYDRYRKKFHAGKFSDLTKENLNLEKIEKYPARSVKK